MSPSAPTRGRWVMWGIPAAIFFIAFLHRVAPGIVAKDIMEAFGASGAIVGLLSSMYFYSYAGFMIPGGLAIDALGGRRVVAAGGAVMGAGTIAMAVAATEPLLFAGRFVVGLGATVTFTGTLAIAAAWFPPSVFGTLAAACALLVRDRPAHTASSALPVPPWADVLAGMAQVLRNPHTWPPFLAFFCFYAAMGNLMLWAVPFLRDTYDLSTPRAALYAMSTSLALLVSGPATGYVSDHVLRRRKLPYVAMALVSCAIWIAFVATLGALPLWGVYAVLFAMGLASGSFVLTWPIGREVNPPALAGIAVAVVNLGGFLGAAVTQGPLGAVLDARWDGVMAAGARVYPLEAYRAAFAICAAFAVAGALLTLAARETRGQNVYREPARRPRSAT